MNVKKMYKLARFLRFTSYITPYHLFWWSVRKRLSLYNVDPLVSFSSSQSSVWYNFFVKIASVYKITKAITILEYI